jgi:uncharacterized membrane protein
VTDSPIHTHSLSNTDFAGRRTALVLRAIVVACGIVVFIGGFVLWSDGHSADPLGLVANRIDAHVIAVEELPCSAVESETCSVVTFETGDDDQPTRVGSFEQGTNSTISAGDNIQVTAAEIGDGDVVYSFFDFQRARPLLILTLVFVTSVIVLGRWRGVGALAGLGTSLAVIAWFTLPSLVDGNNAVAVALVTAGAIAILALYLAHGIGPATDVALLSTLASLGLTGVLAWIFVEASKLTGFTDDASFVLQSLGTEVDPRGILLAGIVIGSLGVLDDVTVTQVSAVVELHTTRPDVERFQIFQRALTIGRDHISSTVNTLFLAYAGAALPLLLLFSSIGESVFGVATREIVATEIVRALVGSIGLVASVPISTWLAVHVVTARRHDTPASAMVAT